MFMLNAIIICPSFGSTRFAYRVALIFHGMKLRDTGCIDFVLAPEGIAKEIARIARSIK